MKLEVFTGKTEEEALQTALECFDTTIDKIIYETEIKKGGLFKGTSYEIKAIKLTTIMEYLKQYLLELLNNASSTKCYVSKNKFISIFQVMPI